MGLWCVGVPLGLEVVVVLIVEVVSLCRDGGGCSSCGAPRLLRQRRVVLRTLDQLLRVRHPVQSSPCVLIGTGVQVQKPRCIRSAKSVVPFFKQTQTDVRISDPNQSTSTITIVRVRSNNVRIPRPRKPTYAIPRVRAPETTDKTAKKIKAKGLFGFNKL